MAENPLLPDAELRALHGLLQRALRKNNSVATPPLSKVTKRPRPAVRGGEAVLAGTLLQLCTGDMLVTEMADGLSAALLRPEFRSKAKHSPSVQSFGDDAPGLLFAAGLASALRRSGDRVVLTLVTAGLASRHWLEALTWAQQELLPLVIAVSDPNGEDAFRNTGDRSEDGLTWTSLGRPASRLKLPVLSVDGEDAVAVYRVMQESVLRARTGGGPAVLWAALPAGKAKRPAAVSPLARLDRYLDTRGISRPD